MNPKVHCIDMRWAIHTWATFEPVLASTLGRQHEMVRLVVRWWPSRCICREGFVNCSLTPKTSHHLTPAIFDRSFQLRRSQASFGDCNLVGAFCFHHAVAECASQGPRCRSPVGEQPPADFGSLQDDYVRWETGIAGVMFQPIPGGSKATFGSVKSNRSRWFGMAGRATGSGWAVRRGRWTA
jgi:hypothetical protein